MDKPMTVQWHTLPEHTRELLKARIRAQVDKGLAAKKPRIARVQLTNLTVRTGQDQGEVTWCTNHLVGAIAAMMADGSLTMSTDGTLR